MYGAVPTIEAQASAPRGVAKPAMNAKQETAALRHELVEAQKHLAEALEQQTATADILKAISRSAFDLSTVLDTLLQTAARICEADIGTIRYRDGSSYLLAATYGCTPEWRDHFAGYSVKADRGSIFGRTIVDGRTVHIPDVLADPEFARPQAQKLIGFRAALGVPVLRDEKTIGVVNLFRFEPRSFSAQQIKLVENFADQAVIAIENTRLLSELRRRTDDLSEALEQQTATSAVLQVISNSPGELEPVFQTILSNATRICDAKFGDLYLRDADGFRMVATHNSPLAFAAARTPDRLLRPPPDAPLGLVSRTLQVAHVHDIRTIDSYINGDPFVTAGVELAGYRTILAIPMLKDNELIGAITICRLEVRPFIDKQIALLHSFAAQAVIAIENTRLLHELRQRTDDLSKLLDNLRTAQDRLVQTEKLASLGQLTAGIAHEIKNPLNFVNNFSAISVDLIDELREALSGAQMNTKLRGDINEIADMLQGNLGKVVQHGKRADSIVKNMLLHSRQDSGERRPININALVEESLNLAYHGARAEKNDFNITLERSLDPAAGEVDLFPQEITRVLLNLFSNGFYAATKRKAEANGGDYEPTLAATTKNLGDSVEIRIRDNGTGIPPEVKAKIFNPFFTTKPAGEGTGLGLSLSHDIVVKQHAGSIEVETRPGDFTEIKIILPRGAATIAKSGEQP